jgi:hypothetical protein
MLTWYITELFVNNAVRRFSGKASSRLLSSILVARHYSRIHFKFAVWLQYRYVTAALGMSLYIKNGGRMSGRRSVRKVLLRGNPGVFLWRNAVPEVPPQKDATRNRLFLRSVQLIHVFDLILGHSVRSVTFFFIDVALGRPIIVITNFRHFE